MECAETRDAGEVRNRDLLSKMRRNVIENATQPGMVKLMRGKRGRRRDAAVAVCVEKAGRKRQRRRLHEHAAGRRLVRHLRQDRASYLLDYSVVHAGGVTDRGARLARKIEIVTQPPKRRGRQVKMQL